MICSHRGCDTVQHLRWGIADPNDTRLSVLHDGLCNQSGWICEIDQPCFGRKLVDDACLLHRDWYGSQCHRHSCWPCSLLPGISMLDRSPLIAGPSGYHSNTNAAEHEISPFDSTFK